MSLVEKEVTQNNVELARNNPEFERRQETEQKIVPVNPDIFVWLYKEAGEKVKQGYLSNPEDEFSLRFRQVGEGDSARFTAALKDRGEIIQGALKRTEVETEISAERFAFYEAMNLPLAEKVRTEIMEGVTVDFYEDSETPVVVEIEHSDPQERESILKTLQELAGPLVDKSDDPALTTEAIAHRIYATKNPEYSRQLPESLDAFIDRVFPEMVAQYVSGKNQVVVTLDGMPGSGKTTVTRGLRERTIEAFGEQYAPAELSTDDYHFGRKALEKEYGAPYTDWDSAKTYDTALLAAHLELHAAGIPLIKRHFDFESEETVLDEELPHSPFVLVEGLYAGSKDLNQARALHYELPTSVATSIGRDVRRLIIENRANRVFPTPESRLRYQMEVALPLHLEKEQPVRKGFDGCVRPLAERAFMLARL